jgi:hypothetical protein
MGAEIAEKQALNAAPECVKFRPRMREASKSQSEKVFMINMLCYFYFSCIYKR